MLEIKITVNCPDLVLAAATLAKCLRPSENVGVAHNAGETLQPCHSGSVDTMPPAVQSAAAAPTLPVAPTAPVSAVSAAPMTTPVPLAAAPQYTMEQIARAGADLVTRDPSKAIAAQQLLASFGIQSVTALPQERFGEFVTALRGLGAQI